MTPSELIEELRSRFTKSASPDLAVSMKAYMKDQFDLFGIKAPDRKELYKDIIPEAKKLDTKSLERLTVLLWDEQKRDFQYFGIDLMQKLGKKIPEDFLPLLQYTIITRSWWDTVDSIASNPLGVMVRRQPEVLRTMDSWINDENMWIRRSALLCQLKSKDQADVGRLFSYCKLRMHEKEFFIRKAIGWALRSHAYQEPERIRSFVEQHKNEMSGLSVREALKNIS